MHEVAHKQTSGVKKLKGDIEKLKTQVKKAYAYITVTKDSQGRSLIPIANGGTIQAGTLKFAESAIVANTDIFNHGVKNGLNCYDI